MYHAEQEISFKGLHNDSIRKLMILTGHSVKPGQWRQMAWREKLPDAWQHVQLTSAAWQQR